MTISRLYILYLAALSMLAFLATDMYLPTFKAMEVDFATGPEQIALSLTVFLVGLGVGQLLWGIASDKFGHRNTLLCGLAIFTLASFGLVFCDQIWQLLTLRLVQAFGVCAPTVIWQAMVIKRHDAPTRQRLFSTIMPLVALSPALAPQLGVLLAHLFHWQSIFVCLTLIGLGLAFITLRQPQDKVEPKQTSMAADMTTLFRNRSYLGNIMMYAMASAAFFAYLTGMPEIMARLGYDAKAIGLSFVPQTIAFMAGGYLGKSIVRKWGDQKTLSRLLQLFSVSAVIVFIATQCQLTSIWPILLPFCFLAAANGATYPIIVNHALSSAKQSPATAAGVQNSLQIGICSIASAIVAALASHAQMVTGDVILICMVGLWIGYAITKRAKPQSEESLSS